MDQRRYTVLDWTEWEVGKFRSQSQYVIGAVRLVPDLELGLTTALWRPRFAESSWGWVGVYSGLVTIHGIPSDSRSGPWRILRLGSRHSLDMDLAGRAGSHSDRGMAHHWVLGPAWSAFKTERKHTVQQPGMTGAVCTSAWPTPYCS